MIELAGALLLGLISLLWIKYLVSRGIVLGSRAEEPEHDAKRTPLQRRWTTQRERHADRWHQPEEQHDAEKSRQRQPKQPAKHSEDDGAWWRVLEVSPDAGADEIRRS